MAELIKSLNVFIQNSEVVSGMTQCTYVPKEGKSTFCKLAVRCAKCSRSLVNKKLIGDILNEHTSDNPS
jgi:hypothetical protein